MLFIIGWLAKAASILYFVYRVVRWAESVAGYPGDSVPLAFFDPLVEAAVVSFVLWAVGVVAAGVGDIQEDSQTMRAMLRQVYEERQAEGAPRRPRDVWADPPAQGQHWYNKFKGWRPEKTPITFDEDDYFPPPRRVQKRRMTQ